MKKAPEGFRTADLRGATITADCLSCKKRHTGALGLTRLVRENGDVIVRLWVTPEGTQDGHEIGIAHVSDLPLEPSDDATPAPDVVN